MQNLNLKMRIGIIVILIISVITIGLYVYRTTKEGNEYEYYQDEIISNENHGEENEINIESTVTVHITGEVCYPGVVILKEGARIVDAIEAAGGEKEEADLNKLNLAYILSDGDKIYVPSKNENNKIDTYSEVIQTGNEMNNNIEVNMININKATLQELEKLPGVGASTANKIIAYRKENGGFNKPEDIKNVPGIGDSKYEAMKDMIKVK